MAHLNSEALDCTSLVNQLHKTVSLSPKKNILLLLHSSLDRLSRALRTVEVHFPACAFSMVFQLIVVSTEAVHCVALLHLAPIGVCECPWRAAEACSNRIRRRVP